MQKPGLTVTDVGGQPAFYQSAPKLSPNQKQNKGRAEERGLQES